VRILVLWSSAEAAEPRKILVTNRTHWEAHRILKVYKRRWSGTETNQKGREATLGHGRVSTQGRDGPDPFPCTSSSWCTPPGTLWVMRQLKHDRALDWAHTRLTTIGESCRSIARETLGKTLAWAVEQAQHGMSLPDIQQRLTLS